MTGSESEEKAYDLYTGAKALLKIGAFNLRKFSTNSSTLQARIDSEESTHLKNPSQSSEETETFSQATLGRGQELRVGEQKVLGINWYVCCDKIVFSWRNWLSRPGDWSPLKEMLLA